MLTNNFLESEPGELNAPRGTYDQAERDDRLWECLQFLIITITHMSKTGDLYPIRKLLTDLRKFS